MLPTCKPIAPRATKASILFALLSAASTQCLAQAGAAPPPSMRDAAANLAQTATLNLMEARLAALEKKLADVEQKLATQQSKLTQQSGELESLKFLPYAFKNHSHDVVIHTIDNSIADVKDINNIKRTVVVPGPSWGNPKGYTGVPKVAPGQPF